MLFEQAVRSRLRDSTPVCAELSGGLDSSSIVCMANSLIAGRSVPAGELVAFSYRGADASDETFWRDVARTCAIDTTEIQVRDHPFASPACVGKGAPLCWEPRFEELRRRMRALGSTMLLTGRMGDIVMGNWFDGSEQICDSLSRHDWRSGFTEACRWSQTLQEPVFSVAKRARLLAKAQWASSAAADSFSPALRQLAREREEQRFDPAFWKSVAVGRRDRLHGILSLLDSRSLECPEPLAGLLCSHPFAHRPLVEFMVSIPANIVYGPGEPRRLMKRAFSKLLPPRILRRKSKTSYTADFRRALRPMAGQLLRENHELRVCEYGYVEPASLKTRLQRFIDGLECGEAQLRNILLFEFWLRNRETRPSHAEASVNLSELVQQPA
jgi:asparagine synthase (glutamine-hydrolysing)